MDDGIKVEDIGPINNALAKWWESQQIMPRDAAFLMAGMAGGLAGGIANDEEHLKEGLILLMKEMRRSAFAAYDAGHP